MTDFVRCVLLIVALMFASTGLIAQSEDKEVLFRLTRNVDQNEILYHLNIDRSGFLDRRAPIEAYWIRNDQPGASEGRRLTGMERRYAYGLRFHEIHDQSARFSFVSYQRDLFLVKRGRDFVVEIEIDGRRLQLNSLHLNLTSSRFWFHRVESIELHARDPKTGVTMVEIIDNP
ncbi:MAG: DUF4833 domain-containing protein [Cryomorphaceae bacterium]|nr:MAG: DUF4833 domain-containing protein [Cryomorphaceae bacterium]